MLSTGTGGTLKLYFQVFLLERFLRIFLGQREDGHRNDAGLPSPVTFGGRDTLDDVFARLVFEGFPDTFSDDFGENVAVLVGKDFRFQAQNGGVFLVRLKEIVDEQL